MKSKIKSKLPLLTREYVGNLVASSALGSIRSLRADLKALAEAKPDLDKLFEVEAQLEVAHREFKSMFRLHRSRKSKEGG